MRRNRKPLKLLKWLAVGLQLFCLILSTASTASDGFLFWPSRLIGSPSSGHNRKEARQREASATTTTTTTTPQPQQPAARIVLAQPAPIELHFEIQAEPAGERALDGDDEAGRPAANLMDSANGSLIFEDLVNQIARNFDERRRDGHEQQVAVDANSTQRAALAVNGRQQLLGQLLVEPAPYDASAALQLVASPAPAEPTSQAGASFRPTPNDSLVEMAQGQADLEDRHIHYDAAPSGDETRPTTNSSETIGSGGSGSSSSANYTLEPIRVRPQTEVDEAPPQPPQSVQQPAESKLHKRHDEQLQRRADGEPEVESSAGGTGLGSEPTGGNGSAPSRAEHQGRSMGGGVTSRLPQHSKPPYASYNLFHHRGADGPAAAVGPSAAHRAPEGANVTAAAAATTTTTSGAAPAPSNAQAGGEARAQGELVESIKRISSHLVGEAANTTPRLQQAADETTTARPAPADSAGGAYESLKEESQQQQQQQQRRREELEQMAAKLAPINELDLSPIPAATPAELPPPAHSMGAAGSEPSGQYYYSQAPGASSFSARPQRGANSPGLYIDGFDSPSATGAPPASDAARPPTSRAGGQLAPAPEDSASGTAFPLPPLVSRKTLEVVSNQIQQADSMHAQTALAQHHAHQDSMRPAAAGGAPQVVHQHKERSPNSLEWHRGAAPQNHAHAHSHWLGAPANSYAASLINVTAPMLLPLSATEAMEASLAGDQAARRHMLHQVGGGGGLLGAGSAHEEGAARTPSATSHQHAPAATTTFALAQRANGYYALVPQSTDQQQPPPASRPAYSRPANSFSPPPRLPSGLSLLADSQRFETTLPVVSAQTTAPPTLSAAERERMRLGDAALAGHAAAPPSQQASGFRSPNYNAFQQHLLSSTAAAAAAGDSWPHTTSLPTPSSYLSAFLAASTVAPPGATGANNSPVAAAAAAQMQANRNGQSGASKNASSPTPSGAPTTTNGFITGLVQSVGVGSNSSSTSSSSFSSSATQAAAAANQQAPQTSQQVVAAAAGGSATAGGEQPPQLSKRVFNLTRVEHISAECSNDLIRTVIIFNGTFTGIIYSSGYVRDPSCLYINGTGKTRYDFSIKLNQCGTLGRKEERPSSKPNEINRRDQVMWNTLSIQYNPIIEQEWDEHFRVSCEYGSDFWKTISFSPFNVETNTGAPVVFTVEPPQCQMEILKGHGMVGPRQEAVTGPVTVGDPLTLLIHMKSEKSGYDILVKNCIAHNGGQQKMQLIDNSGCVANERFISPFRGTYNDNDLKQVTLYAYLKAFRFTGSPVLYLECEVHMCQSACPPQMCYWRRLSKRSTNDSRALLGGADLWPAGLELDHELDAGEAVQSFRLNLTGAPGSDLMVSSTEDPVTTSTTSTTGQPPVAARNQRRGRKMRLESAPAGAASSGKPAAERPTERVSLFQALEVRQEREPDALPPAGLEGRRRGWSGGLSDAERGDSAELEARAPTAANYRGGGEPALMCYRRAEVFAILFTLASLLLAAFGLAIGCCLRAASLRRQAARHQQAAARGKRQQLVAQALTSLSSANLAYAPLKCAPLSTGLQHHQQHHQGDSPSPTASSSAYSDSSACSASRAQLVSGQQRQRLASHNSNHNANLNNQASNLQVMALDLASRRLPPPLLPPPPPVGSFGLAGLEERRRRGRPIGCWPQTQAQEAPGRPGHTRR